MHEELREVMIDRLMQHPPDGCTVVPGSTPVFGFGRILNARVASVSLNPSHREFDDVNGQRSRYGANYWRVKKTES